MTESHELVSAYDALAKSLDSFCSELQTQNPACWVAMDEGEDGIPHLTKAISYYRDIWYKGDQDGRETRSCYGLVLANQKLIELAQQTNQLKDEFKTHVQSIQKRDKDYWLALKAQLNKRHQNLREKLYFNGLARLHLKQAYRHIPILEQWPDKIGFTWYSNGRSIKKLSVEQAEKKLLAMGEDKAHIQAQLQKLYTLPEHEVLAQIQTQVPLVRANLVYKNLNDKGVSETTRKAMNVALPLLIPADKFPFLPEFNQISSTPPEERTRLPRNDFKIENDVFLPSLRTYRYK